MRKSIAATVAILLAAGLAAQAQPEKLSAPRRDFFGAYLGESSAALIQRCNAKKVAVVYGPVQIGPPSHERRQMSTAGPLNENTRVNRIDFIFHRDRLETIHATCKDGRIGEYKKLNKSFKRCYGKATETTRTDKRGLTTCESTFYPRFDGITVTVVLQRRSLRDNAAGEITILCGLLGQPAPKDAASAED